ncbi:hypothetical protein [Mycolicibacterium komossense]|uniref:Uncharacterized protein n=1 Tax=Mycolicibacterium komossense TaxID=1779 RepID=A0ABT3C9D0_9MYCO|nr:hypothetical protein [Mycolicibacterium komossense]MCV7226084.1 hypothetical protein [Mycolicibacterium komossense]
MTTAIEILSPAEVQAEAIAAIRAALPACYGCGLTYASGREHRPDCTVEPSPLLCEDCDAIRLPSEQGPAWHYDTKTRTYHCNTHQKGTTA